MIVIFIVVLLMAFIVLILNLKSYKSLFKSRDKLNQDLIKALDEAKSISEDGNKGVAIIVSTLISIFLLIFYIVCANVFIDEKLLLGYSVFLILFAIISWFRMLKFIMDEKSNGRNILGRLLIPINTVYLIYFIYYYINAL